ncbi:MAG: alpha/beta hydrolase [Pseudomonadota bacterium]|nr:alpha/beta hydrolase [Pseudomonadota bacterium]
MRQHFPTMLLLLLAAPASASGPVAIPIEEVADAYVHPHQRIEVEPGRWMNLHCQGSGSPTVVFDSGLSDWSSTWALIQPAVATRTRACSYDRAGMGYSDPAPRPATPANAVKDLHTLLRKAGINDPLVLVGHSLGGFNMKLYAVTHPEDVAGVVLVDPSEERLWDRIGPALVPRFGAKLVEEAREDDRTALPALLKHFRDCAETTRAGKLDDAAYKRCTDPERTPLGPVILAERKRLQPTVAYQDAQANELAHSMYVPDAEADDEYARLFGAPRPLGDKPLVVLTHSMWDMAPPFGEIGWMSWVTGHQATAALSTRGTQRMVPRSRHNIQIDQPQAVIDAVAEVLDAVVLQGPPE